jgi:hypothetical protein
MEAGGKHGIITQKIELFNSVLLGKQLFLLWDQMGLF